MKHHQIQYIEFLSNNFDSIKEFYQNTFGWKFTDYGPEYTAFAGEGVPGGFAPGTPVKGSILVIIYSGDLEGSKKSVVKSGGSIVHDIFSFPGGRRFHFIDSDGNELAVWSDT